MSNTRKILMPGDSISLKLLNTEGESIQQEEMEFTILAIVGEGGSSICYEACCETTGFHGRLKEFYPIDFCDQKQFFALERDEDNQLVIPSVLDDARKNFENAMLEFKMAYCTLAKAKKESD